MVPSFLDGPPTLTSSRSTSWRFVRLIPRCIVVADSFDGLDTCWQPFRTSGYTFRLTGAKGEVLYGFCAAVMKRVSRTDSGSSSTGGPGAHRSPPSSPGKAASPLGDRGKRASFPTRKNQSGGVSPRSDSPHKHRSSKKTQTPGKGEGEGVVMAPVCFCFTSKFPFYRLHFSVCACLAENYCGDV